MSSHIHEDMLMHVFVLGFYAVKDLYTSSEELDEETDEEKDEE